MISKNFYITTTIPYVNAQPHIGHALEYVQADAIARYQRLLGKQVYFLAGSDENSLKNVQAAEKVGEDVGTFVDRLAKEFADLQEVLNISFDQFIRTSEKRHFSGAQKFWSMCDSEDIYKKGYEGLYCVGCEMFYTDAELIEGNCPDHKKPPEMVKEENYFFKLSRYQDQIRQLIADDVIAVTPEIRKNEMLAFIDRGLEDFSISRSHERAHGWGVPVPGDEEQIMYVWFDALSNYITALDFEDDGELYRDFWLQDGQEREVLHTLGKGVARFHLIYWIGMLLSAKLPLPTQQFVHAYITVEGEKMSKSIGNVLAPKAVAGEYGIDPTRFFFLGALSAYQDSDFAAERFKEYYTAHLVNGIGNLTSRILTMLEKYADGKVPGQASDIFGIDEFWTHYKLNMEKFAFDEVVKGVNALVAKCDGIISEQKPWEKAKNGEDVTDLLYQLAECLVHIGVALYPIIPGSAEKILGSFELKINDLSIQNIEWGLLDGKEKAIKGEILFARIEQ